jgi:hypothetical protein
LIFSFQGAPVGSYPLDQRGEGSLTLGSGVLQPGMYFYALIANGKEIDIKRMIRAVP